MRILSSSSVNPGNRCASSNPTHVSRVERRLRLQNGHPLPFTRFAPMACHSCEGSTVQRHQSFRLVPATTSSGVSGAFLVGCHSPARWGSAETEFVVEGRCPAHIGQPTPPRVRLDTTACHAWSGPRAHSHHAFRPEPAGTCAGPRSPLRLGCHWSATSGNSAAREFVTEARRPAQAGQPVKPLETALETEAVPAAQV
jgi:hypothetical protein